MQVLGTKKSEIEIKNVSVTKVNHLLEMILRNKGVDELWFARNNRIIFRNSMLAFRSNISLMAYVDSGVLEVFERDNKLYLSSQVSFERYLYVLMIIFLLVTYWCFTYNFFYPLGGILVIFAGMIYLIKVRIKNFIRDIVNEINKIED